MNAAIELGLIIAFEFSCIIRGMWDCCNLPLLDSFCREIHLEFIIMPQSMLLFIHNTVMQLKCVLQFKLAHIFTQRVVREWNGLLRPHC